MRTERGGELWKGRASTQEVGPHRDDDRNATPWPRRSMQEIVEEAASGLLEPCSHAIVDGPVGEDLLELVDDDKQAAAVRLVRELPANVAVELRAGLVSVGTEVGEQLFLLRRLRECRVGSDFIAQ